MVPDFSVKSFGFGLYMFEMVSDPNAVSCSEIVNNLGWEVQDVKAAASLLSINILELEIDRTNNKRVFVAAEQGNYPCDLEKRQFEAEMDTKNISEEKRIIKQRVELLIGFNGSL